MKVCVVIPALNEGKTIGKLVERLLSCADRVVVVDDGSTDDTSGQAEKAGAVVLRHDRNCGKGASLRTGFDYALRAGCEQIITMDADGQHDWEELPLFVSEAERSGADIILGTRMGSREGMPFIRLATNVVTSLIVSILSRQKITDSQTGYRLIKREVLEKVALVTSNYETESEILIKAGRKGFKVSEVPIRTIYSGEFSNINRFTDTLRFIKLVIRIAVSFRVC